MKYVLVHNIVKSKDWVETAERSYFYVRANAVEWTTFNNQLFQNRKASRKDVREPSE